MTDSSLKQQIQAALRGFASQSTLSANALALFTTLDYQSNRTLKLPANTAQGLQDHFGFHLNPARASLAEWQTVDVLFQITDAEMQPQNSLFNSTVQVDNSRIESYLFFAIRLHKKSYTRTELATITREVNKHFPMPILLLFQHGTTLTISIINRRLHKRDISKDVLEKVTLIKDICTTNPHRAHLEILADLALSNLTKDHPISNFVELQRAWENSLSSSELNKRFYREIANWYFWATQNVTFPAGGEPDAAKRNDIAIIRLITRLIFVWFVKEKGLIPPDLFNEAKLKELLTDMSPTVSTYYRAILQNLFFATLNQEMDKREFRKKNASGGRDQNRLITTLYRYQDYFAPDKTAQMLKLLCKIPFLNGGLFECLDYEDELNKVVRIDGFSDEQKNPLSVPNFLFFAQEQDVDLNKTYDTKGKRYKVRGLLRILHSYKFTVTENTPIEEEIALDPELLGQVFENLLAAYNPETGATARKQTGSFYTPREIVNYMVDESLLAYLAQSVEQASSLWLPNPVEQASSLLPNKRDRQDAYPPPAEETLKTSKRHLPHWYMQRATYFITFRLADSIPQQRLLQWKRERDEWLKKHPTPLEGKDMEEYRRLFSQRIEDWLDGGMGNCVLGNPTIAQLVGDALRYFDGKRYLLGEWVVMPNHVHAIVTPAPDYELSTILHSWKSYTAQQINKVLKKTGSVWQEESYDHIVRNPAELQRIEQYIVENPLKAGIIVTQGSSLVLKGVDRQDAYPTPNSAVEQGLPPVAQASSLLPKERDRQDAYPTPNSAVEQGLPPVAQASSLLSKERDRQDAYPTEDRLRHLLAYNHEEPQFSAEERRILIQAIDNVKVLDPACGSGAFPIGVLQKLVFLLAKLDPQNQLWKATQMAKANQIDEAKARKAARETLDRAFDFDSLDYARKLYLIQNCIYGVDIQPIAVQIAKLRCFIALIVDQQPDKSLENRGILALPNLETRFVAANTLLSAKIGQGALRSGKVVDLEKELSTVRQRHFGAKTPQTKRKYRAEDQYIRQQIGVELKHDGMPGATADLLTHWNPYDQNTTAPFFDAEWMFGIAEGFAIVVGNPPYVRQEKIKEFKLAFQQTYSCYTGVADLYVYFYECGINLLKAGGILTYISSNTFFRAGYGNKLRHFLSSKVTIQQIIDFGDVAVFTASVNTCIIVVKKQSPVKQTSSLFEGVEQASSLSDRQDACPTGHHIRAMTYQPGAEDLTFEQVFATQSFLLAQKELTAEGWRLEVPITLRLLDKLRKAGTPLGEYVQGRFYRGITTGFNEAFVVDRATRDRLIAEHPSSAELLKPFLRGRDVKRWRVNYQDLWLIFTRRGVDINQYPAIHKHLLQFKARLMPGGAGGRKPGSYQWYEIQDNIAYWQEFELSQIVWGNLATRPQFAFALAGNYLSAPACTIVSDSKYLLAILNSKTTQYLIAQTAAKKTGGVYEFKPMYVSQIPIPAATPVQQAAIEVIVERILAVKQTNSAADVTALEAEIDEQVYRLYGLTAAEVRVVEGKA